MRNFQFIGLFLLFTILVSCTSTPKQAITNADSKVTNFNSVSPINATVQDVGQEYVTNASKNASQIQPIVKPERFIVAGTDDFLNNNAVIFPDTKSTNTSPIILNFASVPVSQAIRVMLGDVLGQKYVIEADLPGTVTLQSGSPVSRDDVFPILESVLKTKGAAIVKSGSTYRIVPVASAIRSGGVNLVTRSSVPGFQIYVHPVDHVSVTEMARILEPIAPAGSILRVDKSRNLLVLAGTNSEISALVETITVFDVDWLAGMSFGFFDLTSTSPEEMVEELEAIFQTSQDGPLEGLLSFIPNDRINAIIAISPRQDLLQQVSTWIDRLDVSGTKNEQRLYVYKVQNGSAEELAGVLQTVLGTSSDDRSRGSFVSPDRITQEVTNFETQDETRSLFRDSEGSGIGAALISNERISIYPYDVKNALVIVASPEDYETVTDILDQLDLVSNQVLLEATIAEVTLRDELDLGLQWFFQDSENLATLSGNSSGAIGSIFPGFSYVFSQPNSRIALNALASITDVNIVSSPSLMVLDNKTATLQVGDEVPVASQQAVTNNINTPIFNTISFRDTGIILRITPRINDSGVVLLEIEQEVSSVVPTVTSGIDSPTIQQRRIETTVTVNDGESLALGGLISDGVTKIENGVPIIHKIPVLGSLFKSSADSTERTELLIIITPRVIRNMDQARKVTDEYRKRLEKLLPLENRIK